MTADLREGLEGAIELLADATPGEWSVKLSPRILSLGDNWSIANCGGSGEADENSDDSNVFIVAPIMDYCRPAEDDAAAIAACVNLIRQHGPALLAQARDAEALRAILGRAKRQMVWHAPEPLPAQWQHMSWEAGHEAPSYWIEDADDIAAIDAIAALAQPGAGAE